MTTAQAQPLAIPSFDSIKKMEERKRSLAPDAEDLAPSRKRLVKDESGQAMRMEAEKEKDIENYQKDALLRQMKEYKRQRKDFEDQCHVLTRKCQHHDDHLRTIDAWFAQLLDEVRVLAAQSLPTPPPSATSTTGEEMYGSALLFESSEQFSTHLHARSENIKGAISDLFGRLPSSSPDVQDLRSQLNHLLAKEKDHAVELRRALDNQQSLDERLEFASERYMRAEKKLDRAKSTQVQKLERQAMMGGNGEASSPTTGKKNGLPSNSDAETNGVLENGTSSAEADSARQEALAAAERQRIQVQEIEAENERLTNDLSAARTRLASLTDDDYAETSLFRTFKSRYDDVIKRINDLEATNVQLREEAQRLQAERTSYRIGLDDDNRNSSNDTEAQIARAETDLARIRSSRDELTAELNIRRSAEENRRTLADQARELATARDSRITCLESEIERLKLQLGESSAAASPSEALDRDALQVKVRTLEGQYALLGNELSSMEAAWNKTSALASRKVEEIAAQEERLARLSAEKTKADQKYFAAMKAKEMREGELRSLKSQNARSSEIVSQLKEAEGKTRELGTNLERQLADSRESLMKLETQHRSMEQKATEANLMTDGLKKQIDELKAMVTTKDKDSLASSKAKRDAEVELEKCQSRLEDSKKQIEVLRKQSATDNNNSSDDWRKIAICSVCNSQLRNAALKTCGHTFCQDCVNRLISNRSRKCPSCSKAFGNNDHMRIVLA